MGDGFACLPTYLLGRALPFARALSFLRHSVARTNGCSTGISTCCPSPTRLRLGLGPDLPWDDERCPGTLRLSVERILTFLFATHTGILTSIRSSCPSGQPSTHSSIRALGLPPASLHPQTNACSTGMFACCPSPTLSASA